MRTDILKNYNLMNEKQLDELLLTEFKKYSDKIIVLDDDPTGTQTVHDITVYTNWDYASIKAGFLEKNQTFYILTNSRALTADESFLLHRDIAHTIHQVSAETGIGYVIISRSDSTLRGHYPLETLTLKEEYEKASGLSVDGEILCPFFKEGGRFTIDNIHYVKNHDELIPAAETEFAKDSTFGYSSSDLCRYVEEKTEGKYCASDVVCIPLSYLRDINLSEIENLLLSAEGFKKIIVNAIDYCDLKVFCTALFRAMSKGKRFLFRSAASLVKVMSGISDRALLTKEELLQHNTNYGGLIIVGSYTAKTTAQLDMLRELEDVALLEFNSDLVTTPCALCDEKKRILNLAQSTIQNGRHAVIYTKRKKLIFDTDTKETVLKRSVAISDALQSFASDLDITPSFIIAKGGITSSDIATKALGITCARVLGQVAPGIPAWEAGPESLYPGISYIIFPGNVGETDTLKKVVSLF